MVCPLCGTAPSNPASAWSVMCECGNLIHTDVAERGRYWGDDQPGPSWETRFMEAFDGFTYLLRVDLGRPVVFWNPGLGLQDSADVEGDVLEAVRRASVKRVLDS